MTTIIDGRGNISRNEKITQEDSFKPISIEEYRKLELTPEQEWDNIYNSKKCSLEALESIEIKKRGRGPDKPIYYSMSKEKGPYYDPGCIHVHIWKNPKLIENFTCEQFQNIPYIQFTDAKPGLYCSICHCRRKQFQFKWNQKLDDNSDKKECYLQYGVKNNYKIPIKEKTVFIENKINENLTPNKTILNWGRIINRLFYSMNNDKIIYTISQYKSLYLWPWQLTSYQKFRLNNPNYKNSCIFIKSDLDKFKDNYSIII